MRTLLVLITVAAAVLPAATQNPNPSTEAEAPRPEWSLGIMLWKSAPRMHFELQLDSTGRLAASQYVTSCEDCRPVHRSFETTIATDEAASLRGAVENGVRYIDFDAGRREADDAAATEDEGPGGVSIHLNVGDLGVAVAARDIERMKDASAEFRAIFRAVNSQLPPEFEPL